MTEDVNASTSNVGDGQSENVVLKSQVAALEARVAEMAAASAIAKQQQQGKESAKPNKSPAGEDVYKQKYTAERIANAIAHNTSIQPSVVEDVVNRFSNRIKISEHNDQLVFHDAQGNPQLDDSGRAKPLSECLATAIAQEAPHLLKHGKPLEDQVGGADAWYEKLMRAAQSNNIAEYRRLQKIGKDQGYGS